MTDQKPLQGKVALITGAAGGIGYSTTIELAQAGADIVAVDFGDEAQRLLTPMVDRLNCSGTRACAFNVDVSDQGAVDTVVANAVAALGQIDILVTAHARSVREPFVLANMDGFRQTIDVCMWGAFYALRACSRQMIALGTGGSIVLIGSPFGHIGAPGSMAYNMAKSAVEMMGRTAALELLEHGIRVNMVEPGWTDTPGERRLFGTAALNEAAKGLPLKRLARPDEIARMILFLVDPKSEYLTGQTYAVDGGFSLPYHMLNRPNPINDHE